MAEGEQMTSTVKTIDENHWEKGYNFIYFLHKQNVSESSGTAGFNLVICIGNSDVVIKKIRLLGSSRLLTWNLYANTVIDTQTGEELKEKPFNSRIVSTSETSVLVNPTITDNGTALFPNDIDSIAIVGANELNKQDESILPEGIFLGKNTYNMLSVKVRNGEGDCNLDVEIIVSKRPRGIISFVKELFNF